MSIDVIDFVLEKVYIDSNTDMSEITILQTSIMYFMKDWARRQNVPIPQREVIKSMEKMGAPSVTALYALHSLISKGYIRKAWTEKQNTTSYILIRNIA